jgi:hypothetical protein
MKNLKAFITSFAIVYLFFGSFGYAQALWEQKICSGGVCASLTSSLDVGATGVNPNQLVNLTFSVYSQTNTNTPPSCSSGKQIFHAIKHGIDGSASNYEYLMSGGGARVDYSFNSLTAGNRHRYQGIFYCWNNVESTKVGLDILLSSGTQMWQTQEINLSTRTAQGATPSGQPGSTPPGENPAEPSQAPKPIDCTKDKDSRDCIYNPLPTDDLTSTFLLIVKGLLSIVGIWAVMFIIVGGFRMVVSAGNEEAVTQAKKTITWAVLGAAAALLSFSIINIVQNLLHSAVRQ